MERRWTWFPWLLVLVLPLLCSPGCTDLGPGTGSAGKKKTSGDAGKISPADLQVKIGEYMPPLAGGKLEIAAPQGWDWARPGSDHLVGFVPSGAQLSNLPRILVSMEDAALIGMFEDAAESNQREFVQLVSDSMAGEKLSEPVRAVTIGEHVFAQFTTFARRQNAVVAQQHLKTVVGGQSYTIRLDVYERQLLKYRDAAYAVAGSMKFSGAGAGPVQPLGDEEATPERPAESEAAPDEATDTQGQDSGQNDSSS
jgi:hypothetical protein